MLKQVVGYTIGIMAALMITTCSMKSCGDVFAGDMTYGVSYMRNGHSEGTEETKTRCVNDGVGIDVGYDFEPLAADLNKYFGMKLRYGGMVTYTNYETAFRVTSTSPESDQRRENSVTMTATVKPGLKILDFHPYLYFGAGPDWMQSNGFDIGMFRGAGLDYDFTDDFSMGFNVRKFFRADGSTYKYGTIQLMMGF